MCLLSFEEEELELAIGEKNALIYESDSKTGHVFFFVAVFLVKNMLDIQIQENLSSIRSRLDRTLSLPSDFLGI